MTACGVKLTWKLLTVSACLCVFLVFCTCAPHKCNVNSYDLGISMCESACGYKVYRLCDWLSHIVVFKCACRRGTAVVDVNKN